MTGNIRNSQECLQENNLFYTLMPTRSRKEPRCLFLWNKLAATTQVEVGRNHAEAGPQLLTQHVKCVPTSSTECRDNACCHELKEEIKHAGLRGLVHLQPNGCPVLTVSRRLR